MLVTNFLQKRKSVRDFKKNEIDKYEMTIIKDAINQVANEDASVLKFKLFENGKIIFDGLNGKAGYGGVMIDAPHYVGIALEDDSAEGKITIGYALEKVNTRIVDLDIDTCWITVDEVDDATMQNIFGEGGEKIHFLIAFGYGKAKKLFDKATTSSRKPLSEVVFQDEIGRPIDVETLETRGLLDIFSTVIYAPSYLNAQPWRFVIKDDVVELYMIKNENENKHYIDMGIVMLYFEALAKEKGLNTTHKIDIKEVGNYIKIAEFSI